MLLGVPPVTFPDNAGQISAVWGGPAPAGEMISTFGFSEQDELTTAELDAIGDAIATNVVPLIASNYSLIEMRSIQQDGANQIAKVAPNGTAGSGDDPVPLNTSVLVAKLTGLSGRANRGRMFVPGVRVGELDASGNLLTPGNLTFWQDAWDAVYDVVVTAERGFVLHHRADVTMSTVTELVVRSKLATQRGRLRD